MPGDRTRINWRDLNSNSHATRLGRHDPARSGRISAVCSTDQGGWSGTAPHSVTTQMLRRRQPLTAELRKRNAGARFQKIAGIPLALMAAYIRSPTTLRTQRSELMRKLLCPDPLDKASSPALQRPSLYASPF